MGKVKLWKMVIALVVIIGVPVLFFQLIGDHPFLEKPNTTKTIAVVNEDAGVDIAGEHKLLGEMYLLFSPTSHLFSGLLFLEALERMD